MMVGITDNLKVIKSMVYGSQFMPTVDENGHPIQSEEQAGKYVKRFKKHVEDGEILRYSMQYQISGLACYKSTDDFINNLRKEEVDKLNESYYGKEKYLKIKQCM